MLPQQNSERNGGELHTYGGLGKRRKRMLPEHRNRKAGPFWHGEEFQTSDASTRSGYPIEGHADAGLHPHFYAEP
jgi:hypothetical protein